MAEEHIDSVQQDEGTGTETTAAAGGSNDLTFDQWLENNPAFRSEFDRRMTKGVQTAQQRWQREQDESQDEAAKLARMTAAQRERYQLDKDKASQCSQSSVLERIARTRFNKQHKQMQRLSRKRIKEIFRKLQVSNLHLQFAVDFRYRKV